MTLLKVKKINFKYGKTTCDYLIQRSWFFSRVGPP